MLYIYICYIYIYIYNILLLLIHDSLIVYLIELELCISQLTVILTGFTK